AATAFLNYGFNRLNLEIINAWADSENKGSRNVLEKLGFNYVNTFQHDGQEEVWYEIKNPNK
ncbi:MAG: N-acetyltransferase, partial [Flavobacterium sp.]